MIKFKTAGKTLQWIAVRYKVSRERVRQIIEGKYELKREKRIMLEQRYKKSLDKAFTKKKLLLEIQRLSVQNRAKEVVFQRRELVRTLHKVYKFNISQLAFLFDRDRSTISNLIKNG